MSDAKTTPLPPMADEIEAHEELTRLGLAALDQTVPSDDQDAAHVAFRDALDSYNDDTLWRLLMRVKL